MNLELRAVHPGQSAPAAIDQFSAAAAGGGKRRFDDALCLHKAIYELCMQMHHIKLSTKFYRWLKQYLSNSIMNSKTFVVQGPAHRKEYCCPTTRSFIQQLCTGNLFVVF